MSSVICTMFEGNYSYGLAALVNSLYQNGFRGQVFAGYRGTLPAWASPRQPVSDGITRFAVADGCEIQFVPVDTEVHFTNYKPRFILDVAESFCSETENIFYFDPDIVVFCRWSFFLEWVQDGVALCADTNWHMSNRHPIRNTWRRHFAERDIALDIPQDTYFNAGFVGLQRQHLKFVTKWQQLLGQSNIEFGSLVAGDRTNPFCGVDQDVLNATTMHVGTPLSPIGPDGMDFRPLGSGFVMSHAVGSTKPWDHCFLAQTLRFLPVSRRVKRFMQNVDGPIHPYSRLALGLKRVDLYLARIFSRLLPN